MTTPETLLGKELDSDPVNDFLAAVRATPRTDEDDSRIFLDDPNHGFVLRAEPTTRKVTAIYLYFTGYEGYVDYAGALPVSLRSDMTRAELEALLGPGRDPQGKGRELIWDGADYNTSIEFRKDGRIRQIAVYT